MTQEAYIIDGIRTPFGNFGGSLSTVRTDDLGAIVLSELLDRHPTLPPEAIDDVIMGCANQAGEDNRNVARMCLLLAGLPWSVPGETVNRLCSSGLSAINHARRAIKSADGELFLCGGVENMTRGPWVISKASKPFGRDSEMHDSSFGWRFVNPLMKERYGIHSMGQTAENLAVKYKISREEQDRFAYNSQRKAAEAQDSGRLKLEILPVTIPRRKQDPLIFARDEFMKPNTTVEVLSRLKPAFDKSTGTVTAGNASGLNDGSAAVIVASDQALEKYKLKPLVKIISSGIAGVEPSIMGIGPVYASQQALKRVGLTLEDMDIIEINEAFAAQCLACFKEWRLDPEDSRINPNGGAIALGHPLGATGARIAYTAALELTQRKKRYALVTLCVGVGQGYALILENAS